MSQQLTNNANGGTDGQTVSYYNSGGTSGDAWSFVQTDAGTGVTYSVEHARGGLAYKYSAGSTAGQCFTEWSKFPHLPDMYVHCNAYLPSGWPGAGFRFCEINDSQSITVSVGITALGRIVVRDSTGATMILSTIRITPNAWFRIELRGHADPAAGYASLKLFTEVDSPHPAEQATSAATFNTQPSGSYASSVRFGFSTIAVANYSFYLDDMILSTIEHSGPADPAYIPSDTHVNTSETIDGGDLVDDDSSGDSQNRAFQYVAGYGNITHSNEQAAHGTVSLKFQPLSGQEAHVDWLSYATLSAAARAYLYLTAMPSEPTELLQLTTTDSGTFYRISRLGVGSDGRVNAFDSTGLLWTSTTVLELNTWYRLEIVTAIGISATTGSVQAAVYALDSTTALDSFSIATANLGTLPIGVIRFGKATATTMTEPFYLDDLAVVRPTADFVGPYFSPPAAPAPYAGIIPSKGWGVGL